MLLSSLFVYNQMGGIDEASLDRLSLVTEVSFSPGTVCSTCSYSEHSCQGALWHRFTGLAQAEDG